MSGVIKVTQKGNFKKTFSFLERALEVINFGSLDYYGKKGVEALRANTPIESGKTAESWYYTIERTKNTASIVWRNSHIEGSCNIAVILQYGHGTRNGGYVEGIDYINPALQPIFDEIAEKAWREAINK